MPGTVTSLRFQKKNRERVNVYLDGDFAFGLPALEAAKLKKGEQLSDRRIAELRTIDLRSKAYDRALRFLGVRPRSRWEVLQNLRRYRPRSADGPLAEGHIEWVVERLEERNYLDDSEFARYWVEQRNRFQPRSPRALRYELQQKGVDRTVADQIIDELSDPDDLCMRAARKRVHRMEHLEESEFRTRLGAYLQRRGFSWGSVGPVLDQLWEEISDSEVSDEKETWS